MRFLIRLMARLLSQNAMESTTLSNSSVDTIWRISRRLENICISLGMSNFDFFKSITSFSGAGRRLELIIEDDQRVVYKDFAHSPSKLKATVQAVKEKYQSRKLIACFEMHTFSTLSKDFLPQYRDSMKEADVAIVFIDRDVVEKKGNGIFTS